MDTQLGNSPETEGEWAVDRILSHANSKSNSIFEVKWKTGDMTWLPYYQVAHLQALTDYLDLLGVTRISNLPKGNGFPPRNDPQVFLRAILPSNPTNSCFIAPFLKSLKTQVPRGFKISSLPFHRSFKNLLPLSVQPSTSKSPCPD